MNASPWPSLYIAGAPKCGTTSLYNYLSQHPSIFLSERKEPGYFLAAARTSSWGGPTGPALYRRIVSSPDEYLELYRAAPGHAIKADATPLYLYPEGVSQAIAQVSPDAKIVVCLRNPADRALSQYLHNRRDALESCELADALNAEADRVQEDWHPGYFYRGFGAYATHLKAYVSTFGRDNIHVVLFEELRESPQRELERITKFLKIHPLHFNTGIVHNRAQSARSQRAQRVINRLASAANSSPLRSVSAARGVYRRLNALNKVEAVTPEGWGSLRGDVLADLAEDIGRLEAFIGRSTDWR